MSKASRRIVEGYQRVLTQQLQTAAKSFYDCYYQPVPTVLKDLKFKPLSKEVLPVDEDFTEEASTWLQGQTITEVAPYQSLILANVLAARTSSGKIVAVRIPSNFNDPKKHDRLKHPTVLQPSAKFPYVHGTHLEILPMVPTISVVMQQHPVQLNQALADTFHVLLNMYHASALHCNDYLRYSLGVLPDGSPTATEPDLLSTSSKKLGKLNQEGWRLALKRYSLMEPVMWVTRDGKPKQEVLFGADYHLKPLELAPQRPTSEFSPLSYTLHLPRRHDPRVPTSYYLSHPKS